MPRPSIYSASGTAMTPNGSRSSAAVTARTSRTPTATRPPASREEAPDPLSRLDRRLGLARAASWFP